MNEEKKSVPKKQWWLVKLVVFLSLIFFGYFGYEYWKSEREKRLAAKHEVEKFDNVESEIFDLSKEYQDEYRDDLSDLTINELREKGAEFIYQMLLKNQVQISDLKSEIELLKSDILKYKNHEKIGKMILVYVSLRDKIFSGQNHLEELKNFELLAISDGNLQNKISDLKKNLSAFATAEKLRSDFKKLIPELIVSKNENRGQGVIAKIRHNMAKLVIVRKISDQNTQNTDGIISFIEKNLHDLNYHEALNLIAALDLQRQKILKEFLINLNASFEVQKIDDGIFNYLKSLT